jgi:hypothetical protein
MEKPTVAFKVPSNVKEGDILISTHKGHPTYYWNGKQLKGLANTDYGFYEAALVDEGAELIIVPIGSSLHIEKQA